VTALRPTIHVDPPEPAPADAAVSICLLGFPPGETLTLHARRDDDFGRTWAAQATFTAGSDGRVDLRTARPLHGDYTEPDPMGLFWSMTVASDDDGAGRGAKNSVKPSHVSLEAEVGGSVVATTELERRYLPAGVLREEVSEDGLVGVFFRPGGDRPRATAVVVSGSGGGLNEPQAALLAGHGVAALALAYFNAGALPTELREIPLEYFAKAFGWLRRTTSLGPAGRVAVVGTSRGGELVLLLGATSPDQVGAVVSYVPSHVVHGAVLRQASSTASGQSAPSWTHRGKPLPYMQAGVTEPPPPALFEPRPLPLTPIFLHQLAHSTALGAATIPVERIAGPVLLISGEEDAMWPSTMMAEQVMARLRAHDHPYPIEHLRYPGAGHTISYPHEPATVLAAIHPVRGLSMAFGGVPQGIAHARADSWPRVIRFLQAGQGSPVR